MCTPHGVLYSREAILKCLLAQKKAAKRMQAACDADAVRRAALADEERFAAEQASLVHFERTQAAGLSDRAGAALASAIKAEVAPLAARNHASSVNAIAERRTIDAASFWHTSARDGVSVDDRPPPPPSGTTCPVTGRPLKLKDLIPVLFTPLRHEVGKYHSGKEKGGESSIPRDADVDGDGDGDRTADTGANESEAGPTTSTSSPHRWMDPVTFDVLTNRSHLVVLKPSGHVMLKETYTRLVRPDGQWEGKPVTGVVELQRGGTGFAAHDKLEGRKATTMSLKSMQNDSRFGLKLNR